MSEKQLEASVSLKDYGLADLKMTVMPSDHLEDNEMLMFVSAGTYKEIKAREEWTEVETPSAH